MQALDVSNISSMPISDLHDVYLGLLLQQHCGHKYQPMGAQSKCICGHTRGNIVSPVDSYTRTCVWHCLPDRTAHYEGGPSEGCLPVWLIHALGSRLLDKHTSHHLCCSEILLEDLPCWLDVRHLETHAGIRYSPAHHSGKTLYLTQGTALCFSSWKFISWSRNSQDHNQTRNWATSV